MASQKEKDCDKYKHKYKITTHFYKGINGSNQQSKKVTSQLKQMCLSAQNQKNHF